jgi:hypothetical protein
MALWKIDEESSDRNFKEVEAYYKFYKLKKSLKRLGLALYSSITSLPLFTNLNTFTLG